MRRDRPDDTNLITHASALREHRVSLPGHIYHLVKCMELKLHDQIDLTQPAIARIIVEALFHQRDRKGCLLFAFVVMPEHLHWLFALP